MCRPLLPLLFLLCLCAPLAAGAAGSPLTLAEAQRAALERNLNLRAAGLQLQARTAEQEGAYGIYDPLLTLNTAAGRTRSRINSTTLSDETNSSLALSGSLSEKLPTGAELALGLQDERTRSSVPLVIDPAYQGELSLSVTQPLLRGFGREVTEGDIRRAEGVTDLAWFDLETTAEGLLQQVRDSWFGILQLQQDLELRRASVALARRLEADNRARVEAGLLPPVELLSAQVGLQLRLREQQDTERALHDALDRLAVLLQQPLPAALPMAWPDTPRLPHDPAAAFRRALHHRPELLRSRRQVALAELEERLAADATRPQLDLVGSYAHRTLEDNWGGSVTQLPRGPQSSWSVGLNFSYPLGNRQQQGALGARRLEVGQARVLYRQQQEDVKNEIRAALRLLDVSRQQVDTAALAAKLAQERLDILVERQRVGLVTVTDVLQGESDLTDARTQLSQARADFQRARTAYLLAVGGLLDEAGFQLSRPQDAGTAPQVEALPGDGTHP